MQRVKKSGAFSKIYYMLKPVIPRRTQIYLRRMVVRRNLERFSDVWPIDPKTSTPPPGWNGWPEKKMFALVLTHDVETNKGHDKVRRLIELEKNLGFRSSFNFVPKRYHVQTEIREYLTDKGFEVGVHGLYHDGKYYTSREVFRNRALKINKFLREWGAVGFRTPSMLHNLDWIHDLDIEYDASTFDTDPFEPQSDGVGTIFPFWVSTDLQKSGYVELPYTLPQDFTLFVLMKERTIDQWKRKTEWIAENGGMVLVNTHPDYMNFGEERAGIEEYPSEYYSEFLRYIKSCYDGLYWLVLPKEMAAFWKENRRDLY
jgi:hypothetical protein